MEDRPVERGELAFSRLSETVTDTDAPSKKLKVHLLDVGLKEYGDAVLCQFGEISVLIDGAHTGDQVGKGGHKSLPDQLGELLKQEPPYRLSLLIISHAHEDHIGCLPHLVKHGLLEADYALVIDPKLGWGVASNDAASTVARSIYLESDRRIHQVTAALREEVRTKGTDDRELKQFLTDAANLEGRYLEMLALLKQNGTKVVQYKGRNKQLRDLEETFVGIGLNVLGPSQEQLLACAFLIAERTTDAFNHIADYFQQDASVSPLSVYRQLVDGTLDELDVQRPGALVNMQSIVTTFEYGGHRLLFAGDMQFSKPGVKNDKILAGVRTLRRKIAELAPYSFVKLSHHGSDNAFSSELMDELGETRYYGICAGESSTAHPHPKILALLKENRDSIEWARTDHNGLTTFTFTEKSDEPEIKLTKGRTNDARPNTDDSEGVEQPSRPPAPPAPPRPPSPPRQPEVVPSPQGVQPFVEVVTRIPHTNTRVTVTIEVQPGAVSNSPAPAQPDAQALKIAGGRPLPPLLFVTDKQALARNIGQAESARLLGSLRERNYLLYDELPPGIVTPDLIANLVREQVKNNPKIEGVVILGGYDVIPAQIIDCLPPDVRRKVRKNRDPDNFYVWSDDIYGDINGDGWPELPVSRIPDGKSSALVFAAIQATNEVRGLGSFGVRNVERPFADRIYQRLPGGKRMRISGPDTFHHPPDFLLEADLVYLMLHGDYVDTSRFWGEGAPSDFEAMNVGNIPERCGPVIFTGCCWGALIVNTPAARVQPGRPFGHKTPKASIAMSFLLGGATGFIGCTGAHYSPREEPYDYFGGPMHDAFWRLYNPQKSPASVLLEAKNHYRQGIPHGQAERPLLEAIEHKVLRQYTCLGLGW